MVTAGRTCTFPGKSIALMTSLRKVATVSTPAAARRPALSISPALLIHIDGGFEIEVVALATTSVHRSLSNNPDWDAAISRKSIAATF